MPKKYVIGSVFHVLLCSFIAFLFWTAGPDPVFLALAATATASALYETFLFSRLWRGISQIPKTWIVEQRNLKLVSRAHRNIPEREAEGKIPDLPTDFGGTPDPTL